MCDRQWLAQSGCVRCVGMQGVMAAPCRSLHTPRHTPDQLAAAWERAGLQASAGAQQQYILYTNACGTLPGVAAPLQVFFAGEATTKLFPATMHGAFHSGLVVVRPPVPCMHPCCPPQISTLVLALLWLLL